MDDVSRKRREKQIRIMTDLFKANFLYHEGLLGEREYQDAKENAEHVLMETAFMSRDEREQIRIEGYKKAKESIDKLIR